MESIRKDLGEIRSAHVDHLIGHRRRIGIGGDQMDGGAQAAVADGVVPVVGDSNRDQIILAGDRRVRGARDAQRSDVARDRGLIRKNELQLGWCGCLHQEVRCLIAGQRPCRAQVMRRRRSGRILRGQERHAKGGAPSR